MLRSRRAPGDRQRADRLLRRALDTAEHLGLHGIAQEASALLEQADLRRVAVR